MCYLIDFIYKIPLVNLFFSLKGKKQHGNWSYVRAYMSFSSLEAFAHGNLYQYLFTIIYHMTVRKSSEGVDSGYLNQRVRNNINKTYQRWFLYM